MTKGLATQRHRSNRKRQDGGG